MTPRLIRRLRALACIAGIALALPAGAQTYPSRPINNAPQPGHQVLPPSASCTLPVYTYRSPLARAIR